MSLALLAPTYVETVRVGRSMSALYGDVDTLNFLLSSTLTGPTLQTWLGASGNEAAFLRAWNSPMGGLALANNLSTMKAVAASVTAMQAVAASATAMQAVAAGAASMQALIFSAQAMQIVAASATAMRAIAANLRAIETVANSSTAMQAVAASSVAMQEVAASNMAMRAVATRTTAMQAVAASSVAMQAVAARASAKQEIWAVNLAADAVLTSEIAKNAIWESDTALTALQANPTQISRQIGISGRTQYASTNQQSFTFVAQGTRVILLRRWYSGNERDYLRWSRSNDNLATPSGRSLYNEPAYGTQTGTYTSNNTYCNSETEAANLVCACNGLRRDNWHNGNTTLYVRYIPV